MKRIWLGIGALVVFFVLGLWCSHAMDKLHTSLAQKLEQAAEAALAGDLQTGVTLAQEAKNSWEAHWHQTAALADHTPMDEIDSLFAQLESYAQAGQISEFAAHCSRLSTLVAATAEAHALSWWNLL